MLRITRLLNIGLNRFTLFRPPGFCRHVTNLTSETNVFDVFGFPKISIGGQDNEQTQVEQQPEATTNPSSNSYVIPGSSYCDLFQKEGDRKELPEQKQSEQENNSSPSKMTKCS